MIPGFAVSPGRSRFAGIVLAIVSVLIPALPLGPLAASPPFPLAALWLGYGWAAGRETGWAPPVILFALGLVHDQFSGGPLGLMAALYLSGFLFAQVAAGLTRALSRVTEWIGFAAAVAAAGGATLLLSALAMDAIAWPPLAIASAITIALFPLVRRLYIVRAPMTGSHA